MGRKGGHFAASHLATTSRLWPSETNDFAYALPCLVTILRLLSGGPIAARMDGGTVRLFKMPGLDSVVPMIFRTNSKEPQSGQPGGLWVSEIGFGPGLRAMQQSPLASGWRRENRLLGVFVTLGGHPGDSGAT